MRASNRRSNEEKYWVQIRNPLTTLFSCSSEVAAFLLNYNSWQVTKFTLRFSVGNGFWLLLVLEWLEIPSGHKESRNLPVSLNAEDILVNTCWEKGIILSLVPIADYLCTACVLYQGLKRNKNICLNEFVNVTAPGKRFHNWGWGQNSMTMWWREYASSWYDSRVPWL